MLALDVAEFSPYVFQILAQLLEYRSDGLSEPYRALFAPLLAPANWERKGNVPALTRLLKAYLKQGAAEVSEALMQQAGAERGGGRSQRNWRARLASSVAQVSASFATREVSW